MRIIQAKDVLKNKYIIKNNLKNMDKRQKEKVVNKIA